MALPAEDRGSILCLPDELLAHIARAVQGLQHASSLSSLAACNRRLCQVVQPIFLAYLDVTVRNVDEIVASVEKMDPAERRHRIQGLRFAEVDRVAQLNQDQLAKVLRLLPDLSQLKILRFAGKFVSPDVCEALRQLTHLKRLTISVDIRKPVFSPPPIVGWLLRALPDGVQLDVLHIAPSAYHYAKQLGPSVSVRSKSIVIDGRPPTPGIRYLDEVDPSWKQLIAASSVSALDVDDWLPQASELERLSQTLRAIDVTSLIACSLTQSSAASAFSCFPVHMPHLRVIAVEANTTVEPFLHRMLTSKGTIFWPTVEIIVIYVRNHPRQMMLGSTRGAPNLRTILTVGQVSVKLMNNPGVSVRAIDYPQGDKQPRYWRSDLLWLADTGDHRFLTE